MTTDPLDPPDLLLQRTVYAANNQGCTVTVPCDYEEGTPKWFTSGGNPAMQPLRQGNHVLGLIDGEETFREMHNALLTATDSTHFIYLLGWILVEGTQLIRGDASSEIITVLRAASQRGVQVRVMLWDQALSTNTNEVNRINGMAHGAAILDNRTLNLGCHHQKVLIVKGANGLVSFCGGVDINPDRVDVTPAQAGSPMHDVHCRINGPASHDLLTLFIQRWTDHPDHEDHDNAKGGLVGISEPLPSASGRHYVQIGRTFANGSAHDGIGPGPSGFTFAPNGEQTIWRMLEHAIGQAKKFIYIEDQYLVDMRASRALVRALPKISHLTILIPHGSISDLHQAPFRRREFITPLRLAGGDKVRVYFLAPLNTPHTYVHAKTWIFDDEYAVIGSANCNRRGYTHDSEVVAGIYDPGSPTECTSFFARKLRIKLWAEHLNMNTPAGEAALFDGVGSSKYWLTPPTGARIGVLNENDGIVWPNPDGAWNSTWDPDGS